jgi:2-polyprenyl-3-methyl-5-hydroxy-6-metoxy-1,4-benzoquinol methylase
MELLQRLAALGDAVPMQPTEAHRSGHAAEVAAGQRFEFGRNWAAFLSTLDDDAIRSAQESLAAMLGMPTLHGMRFLDAGSGSGLFSLAARRLDASVVSFDYDPQSVATTIELKRRYSSDDIEWTVGLGSVLDDAYVASLGDFDVVYSWGVLHHTGDMFRAIDNVASRVKPGGLLFIAIYNDQGRISRYWSRVKRLYNSGRIGRCVAIVAHAPYLLGIRRIVRALSGRALPRGMSLWHDMIDWLGGYPFEVAKPEAIFDNLKRGGFNLERLKTCGGRMGCNEFVFRREAGDENPR